MGRKNALLKKILAVALSFGIAFGSAGLLSGCGQKDTDHTQNPPIVEVVPGPEDNPTNPETPGTEVQETKIEVEDIVDEYFGEKNFANEFNLALIDLVAKKVDISKVKDIDVVSFEAKESGKLVLNVTYEEGNEKASDTITYEGDTTNFENFYNLSTNSTVIINGVITEKGLTADGEVVKDSVAHSALKQAFADLIATYNTEKTAFAGISADDLVIFEEEKPIEYISVQSIVDQTFAGADFDGDLVATAGAIAGTRAPTFDVSKVFAIDYEIKEDGKIAIFAEVTSKNKDRQYIYSFTVNGDMTKYGDYLSLASDFEGAIADFLAEKGLVATSQIDKNSPLALEIATSLTELKANYEVQKAGLNATEKSNIIAGSIFMPAILTSEQYQAMGTTDLNDLAKALLQNSKGQNYDIVTGWTMDDVVATYVEEFGSEAIDRSSMAEVAIITKKGIFKYELWTRRDVGDVTTDRFGMILADNPNTGVNSVSTVCEYSADAIVYDADGKRVEYGVPLTPTALSVEIKDATPSKKNSKNRLL